MILNIRGTHGSGKSWIVHQLLKENHTELLGYNERTVIGYHIPKWDCGIVGRYSNVCGGCDGIKSADEVVGRVRGFNGQFRHIVFEGILVSHTFQRYSDLANELPDFWFLFLDTPLATCLSRVRARRLEKGNTKPLNPKNVVKDHNTIWNKVREKCLSAHHQLKILDWTNPMPQVYEMLQS